MLLNLYFYTILFLLLNKFSPKNLTDCELGNYCEDGVACSTHGNCNINLFEIKHIENSVIDLSKYSTHCYCHYGYSTYNVKEKIDDIDPTSNNDLNDIINLDEMRCCYEQKKQIMAFLLEMFTGIGIGHFYLGNLFLGFFKLCCNIFLYIILCCGTLIICNNENMDENIDHYTVINNNQNHNNNNNENYLQEQENKKVYNKLFYIIILCSILLFSIYFIDLLLLGIGFHTDGYGQPLRMW